MRTAIPPDAAAALVPDGSVVMIGGFMGVGTPQRVIDALVARGAAGLTVVANDTARPGVGIGKLITARCASRVIVSHIGTNQETQRRMLAGEIAIDLVPQGTLAECIRAGGAGLGGVLTATGIGTLAAEGRQVVEVGGREFLVEPALKADVALIAARSADYAANLVYSLTARNFNPLMAMAATTVIAGANEIVPLGVPPPDAIHTPGVLVDHLVERPRPVVVAMDHTQKGAPKIVDELTLPATSHRPVTLVVTELAVIEPTRDGLALRERAPGISVEAIEAATGAALLVPAEVPEMDLSAMPAAA